MINDIASSGRLQILGLTGRGWEAVTDAARGAKLKDPREAFFVAPGVARRWGLDRRQLVKALDALGALGLIETVEQRRGRYRRIRFTRTTDIPPSPPAALPLEYDPIPHKMNQNQPH